MRKQQRCSTHKDINAQRLGRNASKLGNSATSSRDADAARRVIIFPGSRGSENQILLHACCNHSKTWSVTPDMNLPDKVTAKCFLDLELGQTCEEAARVQLVVGKAASALWRE